MILLLPFFVICLYAKLKILLKKYGWWVTIPFCPTGIKRKTGDLIMGGVGFGNFALDFLAFY
jgi:hypothetical protein